jgi:hypothetical protein
LARANTDHHAMRNTCLAYGVSGTSLRALRVNQEGEYPHAALALIDEDPICSR